jgi:long-chain acyl-CoA synthetase
MEISRIFDVLDYQLAHYPRSKAMSSKVGENWKSYSIYELKEIVDKFSIGLLRSGISKHDKVAIISNNRPEWVMVDLALQQIGAVSVPMYPTISVSDYTYILDHSESKIAFAGDSEIAAKAREATKDFNQFAVYTFDILDTYPHWHSLLADISADDLSTLSEFKSKVSAEDLLTIVYTSGTTGKPKGVMLNHKSVVSNLLYACKTRLPDYLKRGEFRSLSFLPLCHIAERVVTFLYLYTGFEIYYAQSLDTLRDDIQEVKPHLFFAVPRLLEKMYDRILGKGYELGFPLKQLFFWAVNLGLRYEPHRNQGIIYNIQHFIASKIIFKKWRQALGGNVELILVGAAPLQARLGRVFWAAGIRIGEAYGLTETSPLISCSLATKKDIRLGYAGMIMDDLEVKIADDGEILVKGWNVMMGYYKEPELTSEVLKDGWFYTGDIGEIMEGKYLKITDRKKEIFKTSGGKYIAPGYMEGKFKECLLIEQIMVVGEAQKFPAALIVPNFEALKDWCVKRDIPFQNPRQAVQHPSVIQKFEREVAKVNEAFGNWEKVKKFKVLDAPWSIDTEELTPTMKLKRRVVQEKFANEIKSFYQ